MRFDPRTARSWLFVPGDSERKLEKSWSLGADALIFDLEDAVAENRKIEARRITSEAILAAREKRAGTLVVIRANSRDTGLTDDDIAQTIEAAPDGYMLPKVVTAEDVRSTAQTLTRLEQRAGRAPGSTFLIPIVTESPAPVFRLPELCTSDPRNAAILWGSEDLSAAIGARRVKDSSGQMLDVFRTVRSLALLAGSAAGLGVIDTPVIDFGNSDELEREAREAYWMGFTGKLAIHPAQVSAINAAFTPDPDELEDARAISAGAEASGAAAFRLGNRMIDMPHIKAAKRLMVLEQMLAQRAAAMGSK
ncbi:MAG TPA: CoA ester lyase [Rhizobiaceae bacterium]|nr:CoA ester lyase [Rhizobiaceae bacterium]